MTLTTEIRSLLSSVDNVYIGNMPAEPNNAVCIYSTGGFPRTLVPGKFEEPTFQIKVRNLSYATGEELCDTIKDVLHGTNTASLPMIEQQGGVFDIGRDASNCQEWTINFRCYYQR